jgi:hypothetical protein
MQAGKKKGLLWLGISPLLYHAKVKNEKRYSKFTYPHAKIGCMNSTKAIDGMKN